MKAEGRILFRDRFGLKYYIYPDMRLSSTIDRGVRTDDEGVLYLSQNIINHIKEKTDSPLACFDVGAYIGVVSLIMAQTLGNRGVVNTFEAEDTNYKRLKENIALNGFAHIRAHNLAVWSESNVPVYSRRDTDSGQSDVQTEPDSGLTSVDTVSIDTFLEDHAISTIDLMKLDVEGSEPHVLLGAENALTKGAISFLIFEILKDTPQEIPVVCTKLSDYGYHLYWIHRDGRISPLTDEMLQSKNWGNGLAVAPQIKIPMHFLAQT